MIIQDIFFHPLYNDGRNFKRYQYYKMSNLYIIYLNYIFKYNLFKYS